ncbi:MAG: MBG domain-containing protein [Clostridia bacterium]|nr:MBG domain-containing protein [Clostridia bacterium]
MSFSVTAKDLVSGEKIDDAVSFTYVTAYDETDPESRNVVYDGETVSGYAVSAEASVWKTANYRLDKADTGLLRITPKEVTVGTKPNTEEGKAPVLDSEGHFSMSYGEDLMGYWFKPEYTGFCYPEDNEETLSLTDDMVSYYITVDGVKMTFTSASSIFPTIAGNYAVMPVTDTLNSIKGNYRYKGVADTTAVVNRRLIDISDFVQILEKVYDGTVLVPERNIRLGGNDTVLTGNGEGFDSDDFDLSYLGTGDKVLSVDLQYLKDNGSTGFVFDLSENGTVFEDRNVGDRKVNLVFSLNEYLGMRYTLVQEHLRKTADSKITRRPLKITAVSPENTIYGSAVPEFSNTYDSFAEGEDVSVLEKITEKPVGTATAKIVEKETGEIWVSQYVDTESNYTEKGEMYIVTPTGFKSGNNGNYFITYESTTINVVETRLSSPSPVWKETPGFTSFTGVSGVGDVTVERYEMSLLKKGEDGKYITVELPESFNSVTPETEYDLSAYLKDSGKGAYAVSVKAIASEVNNEGKWNVGDSEEGISELLRVIEVSLMYDDTDSATAKALSNGSAYTLKISGDESYLAIEGEKDIPFSIVNTGLTATGYTVKSVVCAGNIGDSLENIAFTGSFRRDETSYECDGTFDVARGETEEEDSDNLTAALKVKLQTVKADLDAVLSIEKRVGETEGLLDTMVYNYTVSPVLRINTDVKENDTVDTSGYEYTYVWNIKKQGSAGSGDVISSDDTTDSSLLTFPLGKGFGTYFVTCTVTAVRKDNGEVSSAYVTNKVLGNEKGRFTVSVTKADFVPKVTISDWMYGVERGVPDTTDLPEELIKTKDQIRYFYSKSSDVSGVWTVDSAPQGWSKDIPTDAGKYYVVALIPEQANYNQTLAAPYGFEISKNTFGKTENAVLETNDSEDSTYGVLRWDAVDTIYENRSENGMSSAVALYDITVRFSSNGSQFETVKEEKNVLLNESGLSIEDCLTEAGVYRVYITAVPGNDQDKNNVNAGETAEFEYVVLPCPTDVMPVEKTYDGEEVDLTIDMEDSSYVWYKDGELLDFTGKTLQLTFVNESGIYYGNAVKNGVTYMTLKTDVKISKRTISVETEGAERKYNGEALTESGKTILNVPSRDVVHFTNTGSITDYGKTDNTYTLSITHDDGTEDILSDNYTVYSTLGTLSILKRDVILESPTRSEFYSGYVLYDHNVEVKGDGFIGNEGADFTVIGKQFVNGTSDNTFTYKLKDNTKKDNYSISTVTGTLTVKVIPDPVTVTAASDEKTYDGTALENPGFTYTEGILKDTDTLTAVVKGSVLDPGKEKNVVESYRVMNGDADVTSCYTFGDSEEGILEVKKVTTPVIITAASDKKVYDGTPLYNSGFTYTENVIAETDTLTAVVEGTITFPGTEDNTVKSFRVLRGEKDVTENYTFGDSVKGTLEIQVVPDPITVTANSRDKIYDGTPLTDSGFSFTAGILRDGDTLTAVVEGTITDVGTAENVVKSIKVMRGERDVTSCYTFADPVSGILEIKKVGSKITITAASDEKVYDGTPLQNSEFEYTEGIILPGDTLEVTVEGSVTDLGTVWNEVTSYRVLRGTDDVTDNYQFEEPVKGILEIKKVLTPITITAASDRKVYDGTPLENSDFTYTDGVVRNTDRVTAVVEGSVTDAETKDNIVTSFKIMRGETDATKNYTFAECVKGSLEVTPRPVELLWSEDELFYTGEEQKITATVGNIQTGDSDDSFEITYADNGSDNVNHATEIGYYTATVTGIGNSNYTIDEAKGATGIEKNWKITYLSTDRVATLIPEGNGKLSSYDWYNSNVYVVAPEGFLISDERDGEYKDRLEITKEGYTSLQYHLKETATGAVTDLKTEAERVKNDNSGTETVTDVAIDKTAPVGIITVLGDSFSSMSEDTSYSLFYKNSVVVSFTANDDRLNENVIRPFMMFSLSQPVDKTVTSSGVASVMFRTEDTEYTEGESFTLNGSYKGKVYLLVTDKAGNTCEVSTDNLVVFLDSEKMTETVTYERTSGKTCAVEIRLNGNTVLSVSDEKGELEKGVDYRTNDYGIVLLPKYLETKKKGSYSLEVRYNPLGETYVESGDMNGPLPTAFTLNAVKAKGAVTDLCDQSKTYDGTPVKDLTYRTLSTGVVRIMYEGTTAGGTEYASAEKPTEAGTYKVTVSCADDINYEASSAERTFEILKEKITLTANDNVMYKGKTPEELTYKVSGKLHNPLDLGEVKLTCDVTEESEAGEYDILLSFRDNPNYEVTVRKGTYTVLKKTVPYVFGYLMKLFKGSCFWHWIILGSNIISLIALFFTSKKKKYESEDEKKDRKKTSKRNRIMGILGLALVLIICNIFGGCALEGVLTAVAALTVLPAEYFTYKHKFGDDK